MCHRCEYQLDDEDDEIESPIEHPDVMQAREEFQRLVWDTYGEKQLAWYRQGGRCFNCRGPLKSPRRFMLCTDDHLRCFGCKHLFMFAPLATLENQRAVA